MAKAKSMGARAVMPREMRLKLAAAEYARVCGIGRLASKRTVTLRQLAQEFNLDAAAIAAAAATK